jgi:hypothetical protein
LLIRSGFGLLLDHPSGLNLFYVPPLFCPSDDGRRDLVCWKDGPRGIFSIHCAWNSICLVLDKVEWWEFVWHKHVIPRFSFILWITIRGVLYSIISLGPIVLFRLSDAFYVEVIGNILITYFFYCPFSHHIWYDLCTKCLISFCRCFWVSTILALELECVLFIMCL